MERVWESWGDTYCDNCYDMAYRQVVDEVHDGMVCADCGAVWRQGAWWPPTALDLMARSLDENQDR